MKRKLIISLIATICISNTGCTYRPVIKSLTKTNRIGNFAVIDNSIKLEEGSAIKTDQLRLQINSALLTEYFDGYSVTDPSWRYLVVNVTIENTYENSAMLDLYTDQLSVRWEALGSHEIFPEDAYFNDQLADHNHFIKIFKNTSRTGNLIYVVPENTTEFQLGHKHYLLNFTATENDSWYEDFYGYDSFYEYYNPEIKESYGIMETDYFNLTINSLTPLSDYEAEGSNGQYIALNVTIENMYTDSVSLDFYQYDFTLSWQNFYGNGQYPQSFSEFESFTKNQLPDTYTIFSGDSKTGDMIFLVPKNASNFALEYYDSYGVYRTYIINNELNDI